MWGGRQSAPLFHAPWFLPAPPVDWDGLFYHLTAPNCLFKPIKLAPDWIAHFNFPFLAEMLFIYAMLLRGDIAAESCCNTAYGGLLTAWFIYRPPLLEPPIGWPRCLVLLSMAMIVTLASWAYNDLTLAFYQMAALYAYLRIYS